MDYSIIFVCLMGMGTVFFGLICLIVLTTLLGRVCGQKQQSAPAAACVFHVDGLNAILRFHLGDKPVRPGQKPPRDHCLILQIRTSFRLHRNMAPAKA